MFVPAMHKALDKEENANNDKCEYKKVSHNNMPY